MIEIKTAPNGNPLISCSVSDFKDSMGYCEHKVGFFLKGIRPPPTQATIEGTIGHEKEELYEKEHFKFEPVTTEELEDLKKDIEYAREGLFTLFSRELALKSERVTFLINGRADKVMRNKGTLIVEDSKYPMNKDLYQDKVEPFVDQKLQTLLYLNSKFSEEYGAEEKDCFEIVCQKKAWIVNIKDKATLESIKIFQGFDSKDTEDFLNAKLTKFALIAMGRMDPDHHNDPKKCLSCRFNDCQKRLKA